MLVNTKKSTAIVLGIWLGLWILGNVVSATYTNDDPTAVVLDSVEAIPDVARVDVRWATVSELDTAGFHVMHSTSADGPWERANDDLILAEGEATSGASYRFMDTGLAGGVTYYYYIQEVTASGSPPTHDYKDEWIRSATPKYGTYLPLVVR
jgi:hypothetical protein